MFNSTYGKQGISEKDIQKMLKSSSWHKVAGGKKNLEKAWEEFSDPEYGFAHKKGNKWYSIS